LGEYDYQQQFNMRMRSKYHAFRQLSVMLVVTMCSSVAALAQIKVKGVVVDKQNEPIIGGTVVLKGTTVGTVTNYDGEYEIEVPEKGKALVFLMWG
jgi:hypothetical protein